MKRSEARIREEVSEDSMNTRHTLRKAVAGLLKQTVANAPAVPSSSDRNSVNDTATATNTPKK